MNNAFMWYSELIKPEWAPPAWLFGPVWTFLYILIAISFGFVFYKIYKKELSLKTALPFALNLIFNFLFSPIQFGLENNLLALVDILLVLITLIWAMLIIRPHFKIIFWAQVPYLLWVSFATILQINITLLNI
jgi:translocator protein